MVTIQKLAVSIKDIGGEIVASEEPGGTIKKIRKDAGLTQEELGKLLGMRRETISRIENGSISPSFKSLRKFSKIIVCLKVVREFYAWREASPMEREVRLFRPNLMRMYLNLSGDEIRLIYSLGERSYLRSKKRALRVIK